MAGRPGGVKGYFITLLRKPPVVNRSGRYPPSRHSRPDKIGLRTPRR